MGKTLLALFLLAQAADDQAAADEAVRRFKKAMGNPAASARAAAVLELSKTPHDRTLNRILPLLAGEVSEVRAAAAAAIAEFGDWRKIVTPSLTCALQSNAKDCLVQKAIFETLGKLADPLALSAVHGGFRDADTRVAKAAIACAGAMRQKDSMDALLDLQKEIQKWIKNKQSGPYRDDKGQKGEEDACAARLNDIQEEIIKAYQNITRERWATAPEWEIWWTRKKATFEIPK
jgi:HEAT repeat protein